MEKTFSKNILILSFFLLLVGGILGLALFSSNKMPPQKNFDESSLGLEALDFSLKDKLLRKIDQALAIYSEKGWEEARRALEEIKWACKKGNCDPSGYYLPGQLGAGRC